MLEPNRLESDAISFKEWIQDDPSQALSPAQEQLQSILIWKAAVSHAHEVSDERAAAMLQQVYQQLGRSSSHVPSQMPMVRSPLLSWWQRVVQPLILPQWQVASALGVLVGGVFLLVRLATVSSPEPEIEVYRSISKSNDPSVISSTWPVHELKVANVEEEVQAMISALSVNDYVIENQRLVAPHEIILILRSPSAPPTSKHLRLLQRYQLDAWLATPNTTIQLHLKPHAP